VELLVNDLSLHGQFQDLASFRAAIGRLMAIRQIARRFGRALHCHRSFAQAPVTPTMTMPQAVQALTLEERRALLQWLNQHGPFGRICAAISPTTGLSATATSSRTRPSARRLGVA